MGILTYKPEYAECLMEEGSRDHIDRGEFPERAMYKDIGITSDNETGEVE